MTKKIYKKLIRDKIPEIIESDNQIPEVRSLKGGEYRLELKKKFLEEAKEIIDAKSRDEILGELSDIYEIISALAKDLESNVGIIKKLANEKRKKRGGFDKKLFLESISDKK